MAIHNYNQYTLIKLRKTLCTLANYYCEIHVYYVGRHYSYLLEVVDESEQVMYYCLQLHIDILCR